MSIKLIKQVNYFGKMSTHVYVCGLVCTSPATRLVAHTRPVCLLNKSDSLTCLVEDQIATYRTREGQHQGGHGKKLKVKEPL